MENKPKRRILFIITQNEIGGAQRFVSLFLKNVDLSKFEPALAFGDTSSDNFFSDLNSSFPIFKLNNLKRNPNIISDLKSIFEIRKVIKQFKPDTICLNSSKAGFLGSLASVFPSRIEDLKVIYRIGGWSFNDPWPKFKKNLWIFLERFSAKWKDIIIVNNANDLKQAEELKIKPRHKVVLIYNGIDVYKFSLLPAEEARLKLFEKIAKYSGKIFQVENIIGTIANFYPTKGLEVLIESADDFKDRDDVAFIIIGDGPEKDKLKNLIKEKGLEKKVFLLGRLGNASSYLPAFNLFVLPSHKEGFPWALIEAMSAKLPVIATRVGAVPEIIEDSKNGFIVDPEKSEQISEKIKLILSDDHLKQELSIQAHQTILFKFGLDKMIKQIEDML